ncbi:MAG: glycoside hydrolase family 9 protein, partial [Bryobacteraceae bacterium]
MAYRNQSEPETRFSQLTADRSPVLGVCHLGFLPNARKRIIVRGTVASDENVTLLTPDGKTQTVNFLPAAAYDLGPGSIADFSDVVVPGAYRASFRAEQSAPFVIGADVWQQALNVLATYQGQQRCGTATNRASRPTCHLDDARRRDNGDRADTVGGWHDAGDLRKWVDATLMDLFGLIAILRNLSLFPSSGALSKAALLAEVKYGNNYFLKMQ